MAKILALLCLVAAAGMLTGCATVMNWGGRWNVTIDTDPPGRAVPVTVKNMRGETVESGVTPLTVKIKSGRGYFRGETYTIEAEGAPPATLDSKFNGWYVGNLLIGGVIGFLIVDPLTGAMWRLPDTVAVNMGGPAPSPTRSPTPPSGPSNPFQ